MFYLYDSQMNILDGEILFFPIPGRYTITRIEIFFKYPSTATDLTRA